MFVYYFWPYTVIFANYLYFVFAFNLNDPATYQMNVHEAVDGGTLPSLVIVFMWS